MAFYFGDVFDMDGKTWKVVGMSADGRRVWVDEIPKSATSEMGRELTKVSRNVRFHSLNDVNDLLTEEESAALHERLVAMRASKNVKFDR